jgi:preprotein translocase subunit SecG
MIRKLFLVISALILVFFLLVTPSVVATAGASVEGNNYGVSVGGHA